MSDCTRAIRSAVGDDKLSEAQATEILTRMENIARSRRATHFGRIDEQLKAIAGELKAGDDSLTQIDKRNRLLSLSAFKHQMEVVTSSKSWGKKFLRQLELVDAQQRGLEAKFMAPLAAKIEELGLTDIVNRQQHGREFYEELRNVQKGGTAPVSQGDIGRQMFDLAKFYEASKAERNAMKNRVGAFYPEKDDYGLMQTHSTQRLREMGGAMDAGNKARAKKEFLALVRRVKIAPETLEGRDPAKFWNNVFSNIYEGHHIKAPIDEIDVDKFSGVHGSLANKLSSGRLIRFADAASQFEWNEALGIGAYYQLMIHELRTSAKAIPLMTEFGPNWRNNATEIHKRLKDLSVDDETGERGRSIPTRSAVETRLRLLSGEADAPEGATTMARIVGNVVKWTHLAKMGGVTISSMPDVFHVRNALAQNGLSNLDMMATPLVGKSKEVLEGVNVVSSAFIGALTNRFGVDAFSGGLSRASHWMFKLNLFNKWNDTMQETVSHALSWWLGKHSDSAFGALPEGLQTQLRNSDITELEWDAIRSTARKIEEGGELYQGGQRFILAREVENIPDELIDRIVVAKGRNVTGPNRQNVRDELDIRLSSYFVQQKDLGLNNPTLSTRVITTFGGQKQGTFPRAIADLVMVFKSFPITVFLNFKRRAQDAGMSWNPAQWEKQQWSFAGQTAFLMAATTAAGYLSMTAKDLLNGQTRRRIFDEDGNPNMSVFMRAAAGGGSIGIMGDFLFGEYDRQFKSVTSNLAGPVVGLLDPIGAMATGVRRMVTGEESDTKLLSEGFNLASNNLPFGNLFYVKPVLNAFFWWNLREALSPGVMKRVEKSARENSYKDTWLSPVELSNIPITDPGAKLDAVGESVKSLFE